MNAAVTSLLSQYNPVSSEEYLRALREIIQHIALLGLWRSSFFDRASFFGGTALRIFHGLPRFSEDLDFSLIKPDTKFSFETYIKYVETEMRSMGFDASVDIKNKNALSRVNSAFIKTDSVKAFLQIQAPKAVIDRLHREAKLKIKLEVETDPPANANHEVRILQLPIPFQVRLYAPSALFAGKVHAILCRSWKSRIKGRDFYDFIWFVGMKIPCDLKHLKARMVQSGHFNNNDTLNRERLLGLLKEKFKIVNFKQAAQDVLPFVADRQSVDLWSEVFFWQTAEQMLVVI
jgi:predicted nucleotidyltransferase component of viral defense system